MGNPIGRFEIAANDLESVRSFYVDLFEWSAGSEKSQRYATLDPGEGVGGIVFRADPGVPTFVTFYVEVDDVEKYLERVEQLGGTIYVPATQSPVPGEKMFGVFGDPEGNLVGLRQK
jgi:predicted enzyme related to lactoylglutathione lyase